MKSWKTKQGSEIFKVLDRRSNAYLICCENVNLLVDSGMELDFQYLQSNISTLLPNQRNTGYLILTHSHYDHCQNAFAIQKLEGCKIIMSENESEYAKNGYTPLPDGTYPLTRLISWIGVKLRPKWVEYVPFIPDILVTDELNLAGYGLPIRLIHTQGHSKGSISILVDNEIAIVGDALFGVFRNSVFPPFADDIAGMINSWGKLLDTGCQTFLPGHGNEITRILLQKEYDKFSPRQ